MRKDQKIKKYLSLLLKKVLKSMRSTMKELISLNQNRKWIKLQVQLYFLNLKKLSLRIIILKT